MSSNFFDKEPVMETNPQNSPKELENQLKNLWAQYVRCLDHYGLNETAQKLKSQYFDLYRNYKSNQNWKNIVDSN